MTRLFDRILVVADRQDHRPDALLRGLALARKTQASLDVVAFAHVQVGNLPVELAPADGDRVRDHVLGEHRRWLAQIVRAAGARGVRVDQEVVWHKSPALWVNEHVRERGGTLVVKTGHRSGNWHYTPTDWKLLRGCPVPLLLVAERHWRRGRHVLAAVDLGTRVPHKRALNHRVAAAAAEMSRALECELHLAYAPPCPEVLRDLGIIDSVTALTAAGRRKLDDFVGVLERAGVQPTGTHVRPGPPERALVSVAARQNAALTVLGTVGRKGMVGKLIGNTAERVLTLLKTDVLIVK